MNELNELLPLVRKLAKQFSYGNYDLYEDFVQIGTLGLLKAIKKYDSNHESKAMLSSLAFSYIRGEILHYLRKLPLQECLVDDDNLFRRLPITTPSKAELYESHDYIRWLLDLLNEREKIVMEYIYIKDFNQKETARLLNLSEMTISRAVSNAMKKLRTSLR